MDLYINVEIQTLNFHPPPAFITVSTATAVDRKSKRQIASLGVVCVIESNPVCVCVPVSVRALVQFGAGASQTHL